jgi:hypothetical protein
MSNENKVQYIIEFLKQGSTDSAVKELEKLKTTGDSSAKVLDAIGGAATKAFAVLGGIAFLKSSLDAFMENERAASKLDAALRATGQTAQEYRKELDEFIESMKASTTFTDDEITNVVAKLVALKAPKEGIKDLTRGVFDLSTLMDKDLNRALIAITGALNGEFSAFKALGFQIDENKNSTQNLNSVLEQLTRTAGGQAKAAAESLGGQVTQLKKEFDEVKESIGQMVATGVVEISHFFSVMRALRNEGDMRKEIDKQIEGYEQLIERIQRQSVYMRQMGEISVETSLKVAAALNTIGDALERVKADAKGQGMIGPMNRELDQIGKSLGKTWGRIGGDPEKLKGESGDGGSAAKAQIAALNAEMERTAGLKLIEKLQEQMFTESLTGFDRERAAAAANFEERAAAIEKQSNMARLSEEEKAALEQQNLQTLQTNLDAIAYKEQQVADERTNAEAARMQKVEAFERELQAIKDQSVVAQLNDEEKLMFEVETNHQKRLAQIQELKFEDEDRYNKLMEKEHELYAVEQERAQQEAANNSQQAKMIGQIENLVANNLANAVVDGAMKGKIAWREFARETMAEIAKLILKQLLLNAIAGISKGIGAMFGGGGTATADAQGGMHLAASGYMGMTGGPVVLPKFNVLAGEAGTEFLTVMAHPKHFDMNGVRGMVGSVGSERVAMMGAGSAQRLAAGGMVGGSLDGGSGPSGTVQILISLAPGLKTQIVNEAVKVSVQQVTADMGSHTVLSEATKRLVA